MLIGCQGVTMAKKEPIVWFGMKLSAEEKARIERLAGLEGLSQKEAVLNAVEDRLISYDVEPAHGTMLEKMIRYSGVMDGEKDLSVNKEHLAGYGASRNP